MQGASLEGLGLDGLLKESGAAAWLLYAGAAASGYCLWEQLKFRMYRCALGRRALRQHKRSASGRQQAALATWQQRAADGASARRQA